MDDIGIIGAVNESRFEFHIAPNPCRPQDSSSLEEIFFFWPLGVPSFPHGAAQLARLGRTTLEVECGKISTRSGWYSYRVEMDRRMLIYKESLILKGRNCLDWDKGCVLIWAYSNAGD